MAQDMTDSTRVMPAAALAPDDRTMVAQGPGGAAATVMGQTVVCAVCNSNNPALETFCVECGFLLSSAPGALEALVEDESGPELIESVTGRRFKLKKGINIVGRENCDVLLMEGTVSRRHAQLAVDNGSLTVTDLGSTNGTQVNGSRISPNQPTPLMPGDSVRFGNSTLTVGSANAAEATILAPLPAEQTLAVQVETAPEALTEQALLDEDLPESELQVPEMPISTPPPSRESARSPMARLAPVLLGESIMIAEGTVTIGRRTGNTVVIDNDPYVSGQHAEIVCDSSGCYLIDTGSTNGTVVNGTRLEPGQRQLLLDGDEVTIGQTAYRFETLEEPAEEEPAGPAAPIDFSGGVNPE